jgi:hypothetical protein
LSFAQFEREVTGERIRDKIAASKAKGMWMGGVPPLGYDVVERKLVVNEREAVLVRDIFRRYAEHGSAARLVRELEIEGHTTKAWVTQSGRERLGRSIDQQYLFTLLRNRIYLGEICNHDTWYSAQHEPSFLKSCGTRHTPLSRDESRHRANTVPSIRHCWRGCCSHRMANACCTPS